MPTIGDTVDVNSQRFELQNAWKDLFEHRYERSFLRMCNCEALPTVSRIGRVHSGNLYMLQRIEDASLAGICCQTAESRDSRLGCSVTMKNVMRSCAR